VVRGVTTISMSKTTVITRGMANGTQRDEHVHVNDGGQAVVGNVKSELSVEQRVPITWTPCRFGGRRPWFVCPASSGGRYCGRRVAVLYGAGELFACRRCCGLVYASQQESPHDRSLSQAQKIRFRLGGSPSTFDAFPEKPKRMHRSTYDRLRARGEKVEAVYWDLTDRWLSRPTKHHRA
jgi:hypothetical protein